MKENKLVELSLLIKSAEAAPQSVQIFTKHNTHKAQRILYRNLKSRSRKQVKRDIGLNCFIVQNISMSRPSKHYLQNVLL